MSTLTEQLDTPVQYVASPGKWRVVETRGHPDDRRLHGVVGDFDDPSEAFAKVDEVRFPYTRTVFNDTGDWVLGVTPGNEGQPAAGPES